MCLQFLLSLLLIGQFCIAALVGRPRLWNDQSKSEKHDWQLIVVISDPKLPASNQKFCLQDLHKVDEPRVFIITSNLSLKLGCQKHMCSSLNVCTVRKRTNIWVKHHLFATKTQVSHTKVQQKLHKITNHVEEIHVLGREQNKHLCSHKRGQNLIKALNRQKTYTWAS